MQLIESEQQAGRQQLERVLGSSLFARSEQLSRLLRFLVEQCLGGRDRELKEPVIGVEVFGRKPDYNPKFDPIVRTEARRLRARLTEYYEGTGASDSLVIELPKGGYAPLIRAKPPEDRQPKPRPSSLWSGIGVGLVALLFAIGGWTRLGPGGRPRSRTNAEAYNLYLRARTFEMLPSVKGIEESIDLLEQVIAKDS